LRRSSLRSRASLVAIALLALPVFVPAARAGVPASFPAAGELVRPSVAVRALPSPTARKIGVLTEFRPDFRRRVVLALAARKEASGVWYRVSLPGRPNGRTGWVRAASVALSPVRSEIVVRRGRRTLELYRRGRLRIRTRVVVGAPGMETPLGLFYVTAAFRPTNSFLGSYALETSAYSRLSEWPGGGVVGIHGTSQPWLLGRAVSHGCVRVSNAVALQLRRLAPLGTPVRILR
jgi:lipoprotein-anchoring transpeptidase ErfK/SrfK